MAALDASKVFVAEGSSTVIVADTPEGTTAILNGELKKKSKYKGSWKPRVFELLDDEVGTASMSYYDPSSKVQLGTIDLSDGAMVRLLFADGCDMQIRDATGKVITLRAENNETRDTWCHYIFRKLTGSSGTPTSIVQRQNTLDSSGGSGASSKVVFGGGVRTVADGRNKTDAAVEVEIDAVVPQTLNSKGGTAGFTVDLEDGRKLNVVVPAGSNSGDVLRARIRQMSPDVKVAATAARAKRSVGATAVMACAEDWLHRANVPIVVPCCSTPQQPWEWHGLVVRGSRGATGGLSLLGPRGTPMVDSTADPSFQMQNPSIQDSDATPSLTQASQEGVKQDKKYEGIINTGEYDFKELAHLCRMEDEFKAALAVLWGVADEDDLPDSLQEIDFNDILGSGATAEERGAFLFEKFTSADGYTAEMEADSKELVEKTVGRC